MKTVLIRVAEWTAWLPCLPAKHNSRLSMTNGVTGLQMREDEKLLNVEVTPAQQMKFFPDKDGDGNDINVKHSLYAFQATIACEKKDSHPIPEGPDEEVKQAVVIPGDSRADRRSKK